MANNGELGRRRRILCYEKAEVTIFYRIPPPMASVRRDDGSDMVHSDSGDTIIPSVRLVGDGIGG